MSYDCYVNKIFHKLSNQCSQSIDFELPTTHNAFKFSTVGNMFQPWMDFNLATFWNVLIPQNSKDHRKLVSFLQNFGKAFQFVPPHDEATTHTHWENCYRQNATSKLVIEMLWNWHISIRFSGGVSTSCYPCQNTRGNVSIYLDLSDWLERVVARDTIILTVPELNFRLLKNWKRIRSYLTISFWLWTKQNPVRFIIKRKLSVRSYSCESEQKLKMLARECSARSIDQWKRSPIIYSGGGILLPR